MQFLPANIALFRVDVSTSNILFRVDLKTSSKHIHCYCSKYFLQLNGAGNTGWCLEISKCSPKVF